MKIRIEEMVSRIGIGKHLLAASLCMLIASQVSGSALTVRRRTSISPRFDLAETRKLIAGRMEDAAVGAVTRAIAFQLSALG